MIISPDRRIADQSVDKQQSRRTLIFADAARGELITTSLSLARANPCEATRAAFNAPAPAAGHPSCASIAVIRCHHSTPSGRARVCSSGFVRPVSPRPRRSSSVRRRRIIGPCSPSSRRCCCRRAMSALWVSSVRCIPARAWSTSGGAATTTWGGGGGLRGRPAPGLAPPRPEPLPSPILIFRQIHSHFVFNVLARHARPLIVSPRTGPPSLKIVAAAAPVRVREYRG